MHILSESQYFSLHYEWKNENENPVACGRKETRSNE